MNKCVSTYRKERGEITILDDRNRKQFLSSLKENEDYTETLLKGSVLRTLRQNKYLHAIFNIFCPANFQTPTDAKDYLCRQFLTDTVVFEIPSDVSQADFTLFLFEIMGKSPLNKRREVLKTEIIHNKLWITWVKSTKYLTTKQLNLFIEQISVTATELGLAIPDPKEYMEA